MAKQRKLSNPPITEAVIDIFVKLPPEVDLARLCAAQEPVRDQYPELKERILFQQRFEIKDGKGSVSPMRSSPHGYMFKSSDGKQVFQARLDGFSFNRLKPYTAWEEIRDEAKRLWAVYAKIADPEFVTRVALRYINQIELRLPISDFNEFLSSPVPVPEGVSTAIGFFTRVAVPDSESPATATITQVFNPGANAQTAGLILDIEAGYNSESPMKPEEAWVTLEAIRRLKNRCFFGSLQEKALEPFV